MDREIKNILGFQFEPRKKPKIIRQDRPGSDSDSSWTTVGSSDEEEIRYVRCNKPAEIWCQCKRCETMATEDECLCCHELDVSQLFELQGKTSSILLLSTCIFSSNWK